MKFPGARFLHSWVKIWKLKSLWRLIDNLVGIGSIVNLVSVYKQSSTWVVLRLVGYELISAGQTLYSVLLNCLFQGALFQLIRISKPSWEQDNCLCLIYWKPTHCWTLRYHWTTSYNIITDHRVCSPFDRDRVGIRFVIVVVGGLLPGPVLHCWSAAVTHGGGGCLQHAQISHVWHGAPQTVQAWHDYPAGKKYTETHLSTDIHAQNHFLYNVKFSFTECTVPLLQAHPTDSMNIQYI